MTKTGVIHGRFQVLHHDHLAYLMAGRRDASTCMWVLPIRKKLERFRSLGLRTEVLWERPVTQKGLSAYDIRLRMARGEPRNHSAPPSTGRLMELWDIAARLRKLQEMDSRDVGSFQETLDHLISMNIATLCGHISRRREHAPCSVPYAPVGLIFGID